MPETPALPPALGSWEPHIRAFVCLDPDARSSPGALEGVSVGVKDIIDVRGLPTRNGSLACDGAGPAARDAPVVAALRAAGARILGKTVTTEFAFTDPTDCRNPHDLARTPGGSSSGSGAAVAAGLVDVALGTQTAGSLCRPAAYCGVVGFKPGLGVMPMAGVTPLAPSFDCVGIISGSVALARAAFQAISGQRQEEPPDGPRIAQGLLPGDVVVAPAAIAAWREAGAALASGGAQVLAASLPCDVDRIVAAHRTVMLAEAAQAHHGLLQPDRVDLLRPGFRAALETGIRLPARQVAEARETLAEARDAFWRAMEGVDAILTLPVPDGAPLMDGTTGFQHWLTVWTVLAGPLVSLPWGLDSLGRPRAVMLAAPPGDEMRLLAMAARLEAQAPPLPRPVPPEAG